MTSSSRPEIPSESYTVPEIGICEAKAHLSELIDRVEHGETLKLSRHGRPVVRIVPIDEPRPLLLKGRLGTADDFEQMADWLVDVFEGGPEDDDLLRR